MQWSFNERSALAAGIGLVMLNRAALRAGLRTRVDGWRRAAGLVLRGEESTFVLSAFGLSGGDAREDVARRLHQFFAEEAGLRVRVKRGEDEDRAEPCAGPSYTMRIDAAVKGPRRFVRPDDWSGEASGKESVHADVKPLMNVVCRVDDAGRADVWARVNHVGTDGVPVQAMLTRLERAWGSAETVVFPTAEEFSPYSMPRMCGGRAGVAEVQAFVDFGPLLAWRTESNSRLAEPMTISAAMLWCLGRHAAFERLCMGTTVEVSPRNGLADGVGVVVVRPADYFGRRNGLARYVRDFNRQLERTRLRASVGCRVLDAAALIPPRMAKGLLRYALNQGTRAFGSLGLTMLKDAKVFGAPIGEVGHDNGFIAIGSVALPTARGGRVGCVTIKGPTERIAGHPRVIREAIGSCGGR